MINRVPSYFKEFTCIAEACEDTCCAGWDVVIDNQTYDSYCQMEGTFGDRLRSRMILDQDGDHIFVLDGDRCPFLNNENLCDIYKEKGEDYLSYTCKQYPRYMEEFGILKEIGISLSCPEAARIILGNKSQTDFDLSEDHEIGQQLEEEDKDILEIFLACRDTIIQILEMEDISFGIRAALIADFVAELQDKLDFSEFDAMKPIRVKYSDKSFLMQEISGFSMKKMNDSMKYEDVKSYFETYRDIEHIKPDPLGIKNVLETYWKSEEDRNIYLDQHQAFDQKYKEQYSIYKNILVYFIYRYFMKSFHDFDMSSKIKLAFMSIVMIKELAVIRWLDKGHLSMEDMVEISFSYSKDVEHLVANVESLEREFETEEVYGFNRIINTLICEF